MMDRVSIDLIPTPDRLRNPQAPPSWAQLTRLGGDRVAILFEELRKRAGAIDGLIEDLSFEGPDEGWLPRYRVQETVLFTARIRPGSLEVALRMDPSTRDALLNSRQTNAAGRRALKDSVAAPGGFVARFVLKNSAGVRAFARLLRRRARVPAEKPRKD